MRRLLLLFFLLPLSAKADTAPGFLLDMMYQQCVKSGGSNGMEAQKQQYCLCMRSKMAAWDASTFEELAKETQNGNSIPPMLEVLAKECIAQTLK